MKVYQSPTKNRSDVNRKQLGSSAPDIPAGKSCPATNRLDAGRLGHCRGRGAIDGREVRKRRVAYPDRHAGQDHRSTRAPWDCIHEWRQPDCGPSAKPRNNPSDVIRVSKRITVTICRSTSAICLSFLAPPLRLVAQPSPIRASQRRPAKARPRRTPSQLPVL